MYDGMMIFNKHSNLQCILQKVTILGGDKFWMKLAVFMHALTKLVHLASFSLYDKGAVTKIENWKEISPKIYHNLEIIRSTVFIITYKLPRIFTIGLRFYRNFCKLKRENFDQLLILNVCSSNTRISILTLRCRPAYRTQHEPLVISYEFWSHTIEYRI